MDTITLQIPESFKRQLEKYAARAGTSLEKFALDTLVRGLSEQEQLEYLSDRAAGADCSALERVLANVPGGDPDPEDRID